MNNVVALKEYSVKEDIMDFINSQESDNTKKKYLTNIKKFVDWKWDKPVEFLTVQDINSLNYTDMKKFRDTIRQEYAAGSVNNIMISIYSLLKEMKRVQDEDSNYVYSIEDIDKLRVKMLKNKDIKSSGYLSWEETDEWIEFLEQSSIANKEKKIAFIKLARQTGLRKQALVNIKFSDIHKEDNNYVIHSYLKGKKHKMAIPDNMVDMLWSLKVTGNTNDDYVLDMTVKTCERLLDVIKEQFNIAPERNITLHSLRNLSAWEVYCYTGKDILAVQNHLGHENMETTYNYIKDRESTETSPSLYIGEEINSESIQGIQQKEWENMFDNLPRSVQYEILNKAKEMGYTLS